MSHARVKPAGWAYKEQFTSAEANQLDINVRDSVDKTVAGDTVSGLLTFPSGAGIHIDSGATISVDGSLTVSGSMVLDGELEVQDAINVDVGGLIFVEGDIVIASGGTIELESGGDFTTNLGSTITTSGAATFGGATTLAGVTTISGITTAADLTMTSTNNVKLATRSIQRAVPCRWLGNPTNWAPINYNVMESQIAAAGALYTDISLPHGATVTGFSLGIDPATVSRAGLPGVMPTVVFGRVSVAAGGAGTTISTAVDTSASVGAYEAHHLITSSVIAHLVNATAYRYYLIFNCESGANNDAGLDVYGVLFTITPATYEDFPH